MTDVVVYDKDFRCEPAGGGSPLWHSNHRTIADLVPGDRLWVIASGKSLGRVDDSAGYLVAMWPVQQVIPNPGDDAAYPPRKYGHRVIVNQTEAIHLDQPVCVDHVIRGNGYDRSVPIGRFLRGPRRLTDEKVRQLRSAAGADLAQQWLLGNRTPPTPVGGSGPTNDLLAPTTPIVPAETPDASRREPSFEQPKPATPSTAQPAPSGEPPDASRREFSARKPTGAHPAAHPSPRPPFHAGNVRFAYQLHYHIGFQTLRRVPVFREPRRADTLRDVLPAILERSGYRALEMEIADCWTRLLLSLRPQDAPAKAVQTIKANSSRLLFDAFPEMEQQIGRRSLWSRGYYVRGVGDVPNRAVFDYVARQKEHHEVELGNSVHLADYVHPSPEQFFDLRPFSHCMAEYNCHFVCCPVGHVGAIDRAFAQPLIEYVLQVAEKRRFEIIRWSVLSDHMHLFAALRPDQSPADLALTVMNNTSHWFRKVNPGVFKTWDVPGFWTSSAFLRTAGAATTNQVRGYLGRDGA